MRALNLGKQDVLMPLTQPLEGLCAGLATLPGQRTLLLVSNGFLPIVSQEATVRGVTSGSISLSSRT